jgi:hypothetical protein
VGSVVNLRIEILRVGDGITVFAAIIVGEVEKLLGVGDQVVGISGVSTLVGDGSCSEGGGCLGGKVRPLKQQREIFVSVSKKVEDETFGIA